LERKEKYVIEKPPGFCKAGAAQNSKQWLQVGLGCDQLSLSCLSLAN